MTDLLFTPQHNMVAYLEKTEGNAEFHQIVNFLTSSSIYLALTISPTIYASNIEQFWNTANSQTINDEKQIYAIVDGKTVVTTESSMRRDLLFTNDNRITCLTNAQIFENLPLMGYKEGTGFPHTKGPNFLDPSIDVEVVHKEGGEGSSSGLRRQETMEGTMAYIRFEGAPIQSSDPPLLTGGHTPGSDEGSMTLKELIDLCILLSQKVLDLENVKTAQAKEIACLQKRVTKLEQRQSLRILGFHPFKAGTSRRHSLGWRNVSKQRRKNLKSQQKFQDIDDLVKEEVIVEDNGSGEKGGSTTETVSTARPEVSAGEPKTPPTTTTLFDDKDVTIVDTLTKKRDQDQTERDLEVALKIQAELDEEVKTERERQEEASKAALAKLYDEVQAHIDVDHELAARLTYEEQEKYTVKERSKLLAEFFKRRKKHIAKERAEAIRSKPDTKTQLRNLMMTYLKHTGSSSKQKSPKKKKVNDQEFEDSDKVLKKWLKVVLDDDKSINYKTLDVKSPIVDCESQVLGTMVVRDVHVYKLTRLDRSYRHFLTFSRMLEVLDRQDVLDLHKIVIERFPANDPEGYDLILWGDLKTLMESSEDDEIWKNQQDWKLLIWKLYETCRVHTLILDDSLVSINMFVEKMNTFVNPLATPSIKPKNVKEAMTDPAWIESMQEDLLQFKRLDKMSPKKRTTRASPATTTTTTTPVTNAQLKALIDQGVADALVARDADRSMSSDDSHNSGTGERRQAPLARECAYSYFMKCKPLYFKGTKRVVELTQWNVVHDVAYAMTCTNLKKKMTDKYCPRGKIKKLAVEMLNLKVKGTDVVSYNQSFQELALMRVRMFLEESDKTEKYVSGFPDMIYRSMMESKPKTMQDAIEFATELMDKKISTLAERQAENKRNLDNNNQAQQHPPKKQGVSIAYTIKPGERKEYARTLPLCNKCKFHHNGQCTVKCANCKRVGHLTRDCRGPATTNNRRNPTCYECGNQGHYMSYCPELKNQNHRNQVGGTGARGMVHALGGGETNQDLNDIEDVINA
uniref:CCHC-type domain-containing protein n=1 Tax=Tanacetum cinerariifolium TaxID=118510 RepID=A0A6L2KBJ8_TANCI|nr:hypothetical protein [Tanacetum cinerariifolium]GEU54083.1 hypothetical protein [Tanacetum cinerariifolium]